MKGRPTPIRHDTHPATEREPTQFERLLAVAVKDIYEEAAIYGAPDYQEEAFTDVPTADSISTLTSRLVIDNGVCNGEIYIADPMGIQSFVRSTEDTVWFTKHNGREYPLTNVDMLGYVQNVMQTPATHPVHELGYTPDFGEVQFVRGIRETLALQQPPDCLVHTYVSTAPYVDKGLMQEEDDVTIGKITRKNGESHFVVIPISAHAEAGFVRHPGAAQRSSGYGSFDITAPEDEQITIKLRIEFADDESVPTYEAYYHDASGRPMVVAIERGIIDEKYLLDAVRRFADKKCVL